jgi:hypothetical protein
MVLPRPRMVYIFLETVTTVDIEMPGRAFKLFTSSSFFYTLSHKNVRSMVHWKLKAKYYFEFLGSPLFQGFF